MNPRIYFVVAAIAGGFTAAAAAAQDHDPSPDAAKPSASPSAETLLHEAHQYLRGEGVKPDLNKAEQLLRAALKGGDCEASLGLWELATLFKFGGDGAPKDLDHAQALFQAYNKSCSDSHNGWALIALGISFRDGTGTNVNYRAAVGFLMRALDECKSTRGMDCKQVAHDLYQATLAFQFSQEKVNENMFDATRVDWKFVFDAYSKAGEFGDLDSLSSLAGMYEHGNGVPQDTRKAVELYTAAAEHGNVSGQLGLGALYQTGVGVLQNSVEALKWFDIAAISGNETSVAVRDQLARQMTAGDVAEAQRLAKHFLEEHGAKGTTRTSESKDDLPNVSGTGFFVTQDGYLLTNNHVVKNSNKVEVRTAHENLRASVVCADIPNDLALLKVTGTFTPIPLGDARGVELGDSVMTVGFPNVELQGFSPKLTRGEISSLNGLQDDPRLFQVSVPVQPGNSGGALIDATGNAVGVTAAQLDALTALKTSGSLPQNVNYAIKISYARLLLDCVPGLADKVPSVGKDKLDSKAITDRAREGSALILVWTKR